MLCPTCERQCDDTEEVCLRCRTPLRAPVVMDSPVDQPSDGKSYGWIWAVLALMVGVSFVRGCAAAVSDRKPQVVVAPVDQAAAERAAFFRAFNEKCLKRGNPKDFCDCAGPKILDGFTDEEMGDVLEAMKNGKPDVRVSTIIVQCSK